MTVGHIEYLRRRFVPDPFPLSPTTFNCSRDVEYVLRSCQCFYQDLPAGSKTIPTGFGDLNTVVGSICWPDSEVVRMQIQGQGTL